LVQLERIGRVGADPAPPMPARPRKWDRLFPERSGQQGTVHRPLLPLGRGRERVAQIDTPPSLAVPHAIPAAAVPVTLPRALPDERAAHRGSWPAGRLLYPLPDVLDTVHVVGEDPGRVEGGEDALLAQLAEAHVDLEQLVAGLEEGTEAAPAEPHSLEG